MAVNFGVPNLFTQMGEILYFSRNYGTGHFLNFQFLLGNMIENSVPYSYKKGEKRNKSGLILFLVLFIASGIAVYVYFDQIRILITTGKSNLLEAVDDNLQMELETFGDISDGMREFEKTATGMIAVPQSLSRHSNKKISNRSYFIKAGSCLDMRCQNKILRILRRNKLNFYKTKVRKKTEYFEVISFSDFNLEEAQLRRKLLIADSTLEPYIVPLYGTFRISLGRFPDWNRAMDMSFHLDQLYIETDTRFVLEKRKGSYEVVNLYVGPFYDYKRAESVLTGLRENQGFATAIVTSSR